MEEEVKEPKEYEIAFLARGEDGAREVLRLLQAHEAEVTLQGPVRRIPLAYAIAKEVQAYFGFIRFRASAPHAKALERDVLQNQAVVRSLLVSLPSVGKAVLPLRPERARPPVRPPAERAPLPLSNEALEKKIEEILR